MTHFNVYARRSHIQIAMLTFSLLVFLFLEYEAHGETCDDKIQSLQNENKIMKAQLSEFQRMKLKMFEFEKSLKGLNRTQTNILDNIDEFRSTRKYQQAHMIPSLRKLLPTLTLQVFVDLRYSRYM